MKTVVPSKKILRQHRKYQHAFVEKAIPACTGEAQSKMADEASEKWLINVLY